MALTHFHPPPDPDHSPDVRESAPTRALWRACELADEDPETALAQVNAALALGACVDAPRRLGITPLIEVCMGGHGTLASVLLNAGASLERASHAFFPLLAAARAERPDALFTLLLAGADPNARDANGQSALHEAACMGSAEHVHGLLQAGALVDARDHLGQTPLMRACYFGEVFHVLSLLAAGADPHACDGFGDGPIHFAARAGSVSRVRVLVAHGADLNARGAELRTPLMHCVEARASSAAMELTRLGALVSGLDAQGIGAIDLARTHELSVLEGFLLDTELSRHESLEIATELSPAEDELMGSSKRRL